MASAFDRRRRPSALQPRRPSAEADPTRVKIPNSLLAGADASFAAEQLTQQNLLDYILGCLAEGDVEEVTQIRYHENGFDLGIKQEGKWYRLDVTILPTGDACA